MDGLLFNPIDYTDEAIVAVMDGHTCRQCANRHCNRQGHEGRSLVQICLVRKSKRTKSGHLRVRCDQPACILFSHKNNAK